jgi:hypothetical protein
VSRRGAAARTAAGAALALALLAFPAGGRAAAGPADSLLVLDDSGFVPTACDARLANGLRARFPGLSRALAPAAWSEAHVAGAIDTIRTAWDRASGRDRHLVEWATHRWLEGMPWWEDSARVRALERGLAFVGATWHPGVDRESEDYFYCGSVLRSLTSAPDADEWTAEAFLELLDQGWLTDCAGDFGAEDSAFASELYAPVIRHGEAFLRAHRGTPLARAVQLRVALAHETAWSVQVFAPLEPWTGPGAEAHRRAALRGYERLLRDARDPALRAELRKRAGSLRARRDTGCRTYWVDEN